ncbi:MAG: ATP-binding protein [Ruminococcus sp.]|nr:ATP-binding protein [Ruminococcus sp.]
MNNTALNEAFDIISKRHAEAIATYEERINKVEKEIPEIVHLNSEIANTSKNIIIASLTKGIDIKSRIDEIKRANLYAQRKASELLISHNYSSDYLDIKYYCPKCSDTGYIDDDYCECVNNLVKQINAENINKNSSFKQCTFEDFNLNLFSRSNMHCIKDKNGETFRNISEYEHMKTILQQCIEYSEIFKSSSPSILMSGPTGLGKTHLSLSIARRVMEKGYSVIYNSALDLFNCLEREKFSKNYDSQADTLEGILNVDLLILDDLGVEVDNKFYKSILYNIINTRYIHSIPTIINTNLSLNDLNLKYEDRIVSRMFSYQVMEFYGEDIRMKRESNGKPTF